MSSSQVETGNVLLDSNSEHRVLRSTLQNDQLLEDAHPVLGEGRTCWTVLQRSSPDSTVYI